MLKKVSSVVLASLRGSTYGAEYAFASSLVAALLESLFEHPVRQLDAFAHRASARVLLDKIEFFNSLLGIGQEYQ
jgi:hypothetical protein